MAGGNNEGTRYRSTDSKAKAARKKKTPMGKMPSPQDKGLPKGYKAPPMQPPGQKTHRMPRGYPRVTKA